MRVSRGQSPLSHRQTPSPCEGDEPDKALPQDLSSQREPLTLNTRGSVLGAPSPTSSLSQPPSSLSRLWTGLLAGLLLPPYPSHPFLILHPAAGEIYESEIGLCHSTALNTSVTPTALQTKAKFLTIATRPGRDGHCCPCNPFPTMPPSVWGTPSSGWVSFPRTTEALSCLEPSVEFPLPGILFPSPSNGRGQPLT